MKDFNKIDKVGRSAHFNLTTDPFSPDADHTTFFQTFNLDPAHALTVDQARVYIHFFLSAAGPDHQTVIDRAAHEAIYKLSGGQAKQIDSLMDQALDNAFMEDTQVIQQHHVENTGEKTSLSKAMESKGPGRHRASKVTRLLYAAAIGGVAILVVGLAGGAWIFSHTKETPTLKNVTDTTRSVARRTLKKVTDATKSAAQRTLEQKPDPSDHPDPLSQTPGEEAAGSVPYSDEKMKSFLAEYNLQAYEDSFSDALDAEYFRGITRRIYEETGLMLIQFTTCPSSWKKRYIILEKLLLKPVHTRYFLFWRPDPVVPDWKSGASAEAVKKIQRMLAQVKAYSGDIDGFIGSELTQAIRKFQSQNSLKSTGIPDPTTLFFLTALSDPKK